MASLGPVVGAAKVYRGELSREEYLKQYGYRGLHEFELCIPHPEEDANWPEQQIEEYKKSDPKVEGLLAKQHAQYEAAWESLPGWGTICFFSIGAPLSHAAILARELPIPAVVGSAMPQQG
ncbi:PEP-utilizing enzyme [Paenibacillus apiarius]|nr:PEP-utilizing enzyme [Paenibacillus apiarius]MCY9556274.1 PEP-utilizing enzyme [Paenibacillus apiarius]MCY9722367.1 PEP-utilizing enzyme [Paenibacillus apiarius]MCY9792267.1 PEP-utilizing enzyme [Paenibacillus apiarius]